MIDTPIMLFDGTSVSKAGAGAAAAVLLMPNGRRYTVSQFLGKATKPEAAYRGLLIGLQKAQKLGIRQLEIKGDSEIVFHQVNGSVQVREQKLLPLYQEAIKLMRTFDKVSLDLIPPEQNRSAAAAVSRCIGEALGIDTQSGTPIAAQITPNVARLIKLGTKATERDYRKLVAEDDDFTAKSLSELRELVPNTIRDEIALHWDGKDSNLAEIYRWYLRGLSPEIAIRKVEIDTRFNQRERQIDKLPWEGELQSNSTSEQVEFDSQNPFLSSKNTGNSSPTNLTIQPTLILSNLANLDNTFVEQLDSDLEPVITSSPELMVSSYEDQREPDYSKDTWPSDEKIKHIVDLIEGLSPEEKTNLIQQLVKVSDLANLMLKAIAEQMSINK